MDISRSVIEHSSVAWESFLFESEHGAHVEVSPVRDMASPSPFEIGDMWEGCAAWRIGRNYVRSGCVDALRAWDEWEAYRDDPVWWLETYGAAPVEPVTVRRGEFIAVTLEGDADRLELLLNDYAAWADGEVSDLFVTPADGGAYWDVIYMAADDVTAEDLRCHLDLPNF